MTLLCSSTCCFPCLFHTHCCSHSHVYSTPIAVPIPMYIPHSLLFWFPCVFHTHCCSHSHVYSTPIAVPIPMYIPHSLLFWYPCVFHTHCCSHSHVYSSLLAVPIPMCIPHSLLFPFPCSADTHSNAFWNFVRDILKTPTPEQIACHKPKPILLDTGMVCVVCSITASILSFEAWCSCCLLCLSFADPHSLSQITWPYPWHPHIIPLQIARVGQLIIVAVPGEFTWASYFHELSVHSTVYYCTL